MATDPFQLADPFSSPFSFPGRRARQESLIPQFTPEEAKRSLLSRIGGGAVSTLGTIGGVLDELFGGRAIRGVLGGRPEELLTLLPTQTLESAASSLLGVRAPDAQSEVSGRDLLEQAGLVSRGAGFLKGTLPGIAAEIVLDPVGTTLGLGLGAAVTPAGRVAKALGKLPKALSASEDVTKFRRVVREAAEGGLPNLIRKAASGELVTGAGTQRVRKTLGDIITSPAEMAQARSIANNLGLAKTDEAFNTLLRQNLGGVAGLRLPFAKQGLPILTGQASQAANNILNTIGKVISTAPAARYLGAAFDPVVQTTRSMIGQFAAREFTKASETAENTLNLMVGSALKTMSDQKLFTPEWQRKFTQFNEGVIGAESIPDELVKISNTGQEILADLKQRKFDVGIWDRVDEATELDKFGKYWPRQDPTKAFFEKSSNKVFLPEDPLKRIDPLKDIPGVTEGINDMFRDPKIASDAAKLKGAEASDYIMDNYLGVTAEQRGRFSELAQAEASGQLLEEAAQAEFNALKAQQAKAKILSKMTASVSKERLESNIPYFEGGMGPFMARALRDEEAIHSAIAIHTMAGMSAVSAGRGLEGTVPLTEMLVKSGIKNPTGVSKSLEQIIKLGDDFVTDKVTLRALKSELDAEIIKGSTSRIKKVLSKIDDHVSVPQEVADDAKRFHDFRSFGKDVEPIFKWIHKSTQAFKRIATLPFLSFHVRNDNSGMWQNMIGGATDPSAPDPLTAFLRPRSKMKDILRGRAVSGLQRIPGFEGLTDQQATTQFIMWAAATSTTSRRVTFGRDILEESIPRADAPRNLARELAEETVGLKDFTLPGQAGVGGPITTELSLGTVLGKLKPKSLRQELKGANIFNSDEQFILIRGGQEASDLVENVNRGSAFMAFLLQGMSMDQAALRSKALHVDYRKLSNFEKRTVRWLIPFYTWNRSMIPFQMTELFRKPGGASAQAIRGVRRTREDLEEQGGFILPEQIAQGLAIPLGRTSQGDLRLLSNLDLPFETVASTIAIKPTVQGSILNTSRSIMAQLNPMLRIPLELGANKSFFFDEPLTDIQARGGGITGSLLLDQLLLSSPFARPAATTRQLRRLGETRDVTRLLNFATGLRISNVDEQVALNRSARDILNEMLSGRENVLSFTRQFVPREAQGEVSPETLQLMGLLNSFEASARKRSQERRAKQGAR